MSVSMRCSHAATTLAKPVLQLRTTEIVAVLDDTQPVSLAIPNQFQPNLRRLHAAHSKTGPSRNDADRNSGGLNGDRPAGGSGAARDTGTARNATQAAVYGTFD